MKSFKVNKKKTTTGINEKSDKKNMTKKFANKFKVIFDDKYCQSNDNFNGINVAWLKIYEKFIASEVKAMIHKLKGTLRQNSINSFHLKFGTEYSNRLIAKFLYVGTMHNYLPIKVISNVITPMIIA